MQLVGLNLVCNPSSSFAMLTRYSNKMYPAAGNINKKGSNNGLSPILELEGYCPDAPFAMPQSSTHSYMPAGGTAAQIPDPHFDLERTKNLLQPSTETADQGFPTGDDLMQFLNLPESPAGDEPPPSVLREFDTPSTMTPGSVYDSSLQYSPPSANDLATAGFVEAPSMITNEVDWAAVADHALHGYTNHQLDYSDEQQYMDGKLDLTGQNMPLTPPSTANSPLYGLKLQPGRVYFHLQEMLEANSITLKDQDGVVVELFARIVYTQRQNIEKKQLFKLRDLFKIKPPYMSAVLLN